MSHDTIDPSSGLTADPFEGVRHVQMPGELGPPPVAVGFDVPPRWETLSAMGHTALLAEPDPTPERMTTTIHLSTTRSAGTSISILAEGARDALVRQVEQVTVADERVLVIDDVPTLLREYRVSMPERVDRPVLEFGLYLVVEHAGTTAVDGVEFHITGDAERRAEVLAVVDGIIGSLQLGRVRDDA